MGQVLVFHGLNNYGWKLAENFISHVFAAESKFLILN